MHMRCTPGPADSSIFDEINGDSPAKQQAALGVYWTKADKTPGSRMRRWALMRDRMAASLKPRMEDAGLFIFNTCPQFVRTIPVLPRDEKKPDDIDTDAEDHIADEAGYRLLKEATGAMTINMGFSTNG